MYVVTTVKVYSKSAIHYLSLSSIKVVEQWDQITGGVLTSVIFISTKNIHIAT